MEKKEPIKINLSTAIFIFLIIILSGMLAMLQYKNQELIKGNNQQNVTQSQITENKIEELQNTSVFNNETTNENSTFTENSTKTESKSSITENTTSVESNSKEKTSNSSKSNTSKNNTNNTSSNSIASKKEKKETVEEKIIGIWKLDKRLDYEGNDIGIGKVYANRMEFKEKGILKYAIGITASSDDGKYTVSGNTIKYGVPTDIKGEFSWSTFTYIPEDDTLKEEIDNFGEKEICIYTRVK